MKKLLSMLLAAILLTGCSALAEVPEATPGPTEGEVVALEGDVDAAQVGEPEASAEAPETEAPGATPAAGVRVGFEDGFSLELPEGWLYHPTTEDMAESGVVYCLSDAAGSGWLYVQNWDTDCADMNELKALIDRTTDIQSSGVYTFNGTDFVVYDLTEGDVSCCAALLDGGKLLNLVFTPQSDAAFMAVAAQILNTFEIL